MNDEIKKQIKAIQAEAQTKIDALFPGFRVAVLIPERTQADIRSSVAQALEGREAIGLSASNNIEGEAPLTVDSANRQERDLVEAALRDLSAVADLEK